MTTRIHTFTFVIHTCAVHKYSVATCSTCDSVWLEADAFLPLLPTFDSQPPAVGQRSHPSTWGSGVDVFTDLV